MQKKLGFRTELLVDVVCVTWRAKAVVMATHHRPFPLKNIERRTTQVRKTTDQRSSNVAKLELACWSKQMQEVCWRTFHFYSLVWRSCGWTSPPSWSVRMITLGCGWLWSQSCWLFWWLIYNGDVSHADNCDYVDKLTTPLKLEINNVQNDPDNYKK